MTGRTKKQEPRTHEARGEGQGVGVCRRGVGEGVPCPPPGEETAIPAASDSAPVDGRIPFGRLVELLEETGDAHHAAFEHTGGADPAWAEWYAEHLLTVGGTAFGDAVSLKRLTELLERAQSEWEAGPRSRPWPEFYASLILAEIGV